VSSVVEALATRGGVGLLASGYIGEMGSSSVVVPNEHLPMGGRSDASNEEKPYVPTSELPLPMLVDFRKSPKLWREPQSKTESLYPLLLSFLLVIVFLPPSCCVVSRVVSLVVCVPCSWVKRENIIEKQRDS